MCTPDMVWRPKQSLSHEKRCLLDNAADGRGPAFAPLGPEHPRIFNSKPSTHSTSYSAPSYTTQRTPVYTQTPPPRPARPSYNVPNLVKESTYGAPAPRGGYGIPRGQPLGPEAWLKAKNL